MTDAAKPPLSTDSEAVAARSGRIAHDLNNMLTVILGNVEWAVAHCDDAKVCARLERALEAARRGEALTADLMSASAAGAGKAAPFNLVQSLGGMIGLSGKPRTGPAVASGDETILMVEDNAEVMDVGQSILSELGYRVLTATSADEALTVLDRETAIDMVFTDIVMPGDRNGVALAHEVRLRRPQTVVLLTTGWADREQNPDDDRDGFNLIGKPYRREDLARKVRQLLDARAGAVT